MYTYNRSTLLEILNAREATVKFKKLDGANRTMRCTLSAAVLPQTIRKVYEAKMKTANTEEENTLTVFDLDEQDWRSFRIDRIIEVL